MNKRNALPLRPSHGCHFRHWFSKTETVVETSVLQQCGVEARLIILQPKQYGFLRFSTGYIWGTNYKDFSSSLLIFFLWGITLTPLIRMFMYIYCLNELPFHFYLLRPERGGVHFLSVKYSLLSVSLVSCTQVQTPEILDSSQPFYWTHTLSLQMSSPWSQLSCIVFYYFVCGNPVKQSRCNERLHETMRKNTKFRALVVTSKYR